MTADKNIDKPAFYITTPIYYVNDKPHIGHAYTTLACDALARFKRLDGYDVKFLTGTDEHGQKVEKSAQAAGIDAQAFTDQVSQNFRDLVKDMDVTATGFIRTTEDRHARACQHLWQVIDQAGYLYLDNYGGWYSVRDEAYFGADELQEGPGGEKLAPTGAPVEWVEEPSYFFRLSAFRDKLLAFYEENPDFIAPDTRRNEVISFVKGGLKDLSVSRTTFSWGIPVPGDDAHVMYVWFDALTNYITELGYPDATSVDWRRFWPADVHVVGKDILRFHTVYWPAFLMAAGLPLPKRVFAHGWWTNEGQKISKSLGNVIDPYDLIRDFGMDQTRYFLLREVPFGNDGDFSRAAMIGRINSDLANGFGNLAQRTLSMVNKNCGGKVPAASALTAEDTALLLQAGELADKLRGHMDKQALHLALADIWALIGEGDGYVARNAPWALKKTDPDRMAAVLYVAAEVVRHVALYAQPFIPVAAGRILDQLNVAADQRRFDRAGDAGRLVAGAPINPPEGVFPRVQEMPRDKVEA